MSLLWFLIIGVVAGWIAGSLMKGGGFGLVVGVIGAVVGGLIFDLLGVVAMGRFGHLVMATVGAMVFIAVLRMLKRG